MSAALWWIVLGFAVMIAELFLNSFVVVFFGAGAIVTGIAIWVGLPSNGGLPYLLFTVVSLSLLFGLRSHFQRLLQGDVADAGVDDDFIGFDARIIDGFGATDLGRGRVDYRGSAWQARCDKIGLHAGQLVKITGRDGTTLQIEVVE